MDKELNEAICNLKELIEDKDKYIKYHGWVGTKVFENIETVLNYIENSIPKKKVENKIEELKHMQIGAGTGIYAAQVDILEELLNKN